MQQSYPQGLQFACRNSTIRCDCWHAFWIWYLFRVDSIRRSREKVWWVVSLIAFVRRLQLPSSLLHFGSPSFVRYTWDNRRHFDLARHVRQKKQMAGAKPSGKKDVHHWSQWAVFQNRCFSKMSVDWYVRWQDYLLKKNEERQITMLGERKKNPFRTGANRARREERRLAWSLSPIEIYWSFLTHKLFLLCEKKNRCNAVPANNDFDQCASKLFEIYPVIVSRPNSPINLNCQCTSNVTHFDRSRRSEIN